MSVSVLKQKAFESPEVKAAYDELSDEFKRISSLITMREQYDFSNAIANPYTKQRENSAKAS